MSIIPRQLPAFLPLPIPNCLTAKCQLWIFYGHSKKEKKREIFSAQPTQMQCSKSGQLLWRHLHEKSYSLYGIASLKKRHFMVKRKKKMKISLWLYRVHWIKRCKKIFHFICDQDLVFWLLCGQRQLILDLQINEIIILLFFKVWNFYEVSWKKYQFSH